MVRLPPDHTFFSTAFSTALPTTFPTGPTCCRRPAWPQPAQSSFPPPALRSEYFASRSCLRGRRIQTVAAKRPSSSSSSQRSRASSGCQVVAGDRPLDSMGPTGETLDETRVAPSAPRWRSILEFVVSTTSVLPSMARASHVVSDGLSTCRRPSSGMTVSRESSRR